MIKYLLDNDYSVNIASNTISNAKKILNNHLNGNTVFWEAGDDALLTELVKNSDLVVSLLPFSFHPGVARICIEYSKHMVTTSYVKGEMLALNKQAIDKGVILLNEIGLDPGIDHMSAMKIINNVIDAGGKIEKFYSICGALPAPEAANNPLKYKFSWSPKGVIMASKNNALYLKDNKRIAVSPKDLFKDIFPFNFDGLSNFIVYPNRDSISYIDIYGLKGVSTIFRGTFRYEGWCRTLDAMKTLNLLSEEKGDYSGMSYADLIMSRISEGKGTLKEQTASHLGIATDSLAMISFEWLGLFGEEKVPENMYTLFDIISDLMIGKMVLGENERDMIALQHLFLASYKDGRKEVISSRMVDYGTPATDTSIARTVALPAAIAVRLILEKKINLTGVHRPVLKEIYEPILTELENMGIIMEEEYGLPESKMIN